ncbi:heavy-metal-associated domain-containing protein [Mangrovimonas sp. TPBH4]|uniref:heavy-metal-associated domain-containing protein n=1 Tax=Mangrovimonas sp. TPBH4 TaxID=1645914 RepID=UPI0006B60EA4|nr:heavy metal-associated domain-containing protein [Mangrovimonas sp. TPBH4]
MKSIFTILAVGALTLSNVSCKDNSAPEVKTVAIETGAEEAKQLDPNATYAKAEFSIEGMTCAIGCAKTIEKNISKMDGVKSATVDFDKKLAMVEYDEAKVTPSSLEETVTTTGTTYKVSDMKTVETFSETSTSSAH